MRPTYRELHVRDVEKLLCEHGIDPEKWWKANKKQNGKLLNGLIRCFRKKVSNRRFNSNVYKKVCNKNVDRYVKTLKL